MSTPDPSVLPTRCIDVAAEIEAEADLMHPALTSLPGAARRLRDAAEQVRDLAAERDRYRKALNEIHDMLQAGQVEDAIQLVINTAPEGHG